jgi:hypothetical protein
VKKVASQLGVSELTLSNVVKGFVRDDAFVSAFRKALLVDGVDLLNRNAYKRALNAYFKQAKATKPNYFALVATTTWASVQVANGVRIHYRSTVEGTETLTIAQVAYRHVSFDKVHDEVDTTDEVLIADAAEVARLAMNRKRREPKSTRRKKS